MINIVETQCSCNTCKAMCKNAACFPTPHEVEKLVASGYQHRLETIGWWSAVDNVILPLIAPIENGSVCNFLDMDGLCSLHDLGLKPTEGRFAYHGNETGFSSMLRRNVAHTWLTEKGLEVMRKYDKTTTGYDILNFTKLLLTEKGILK